MDPDHLDERDHLVQELLTLAETSGDAEALAMAYSMRARDRIERGAFSAAEQDMLTALRLGNEVSQPHFRWIHTLWTAVLRMVRGDFAAAEELVATAREEGARIHEPNAMVLAMIQSVVLQLTRGRDAGLDLQLSHIVAASPGIPLTEPALAFVYSRNGREREAVEVAERILAGGIENLPWDTTWLSTLGFLGEVYARAGVVGRCRVLYEILLPYEDRYFVVGIYAAGCAGIVAHTLGVMAMALGNHQQAEAHLRHALERLEANGLRPFVARAHLALGQLLERRGDSGAPAETDRARELAAEIGMDGIG